MVCRLKSQGLAYGLDLGFRDIQDCDFGVALSRSSVRVSGAPLGWRSETCRASRFVPAQGAIVDARSGDQRRKPRWSDEEDSWDELDSAAAPSTAQPWYQPSKSEARDHAPPPPWQGPAPHGPA